MSLTIFHAFYFVEGHLAHGVGEYLIPGNTARSEEVGELAVGLVGSNAGIMLGSFGWWLAVPPAN